MKIAFDATALYGRWGGIENALWQTISRLSSLDKTNQYLVFVPRDAPNGFNEPPYSKNPRWRIVRLPFDGARKARRIFWQQCELPRLLQREKCDLLHAWNYVAPLFSPVPIVLTVQDLIALDAPRFATRFNRWHYRAIMPRSLKNAARVIVTTQKTAHAVKRRAPHAQIRLIPLGIDDIFFEELPQEHLTHCIETYKLPPRFLLYVGNFEPKKNLPNLLRALQTLPDAPPLVVAGGIKPWPQSETSLRGVQRLGFVPREDLPALYALCEAFCFPSLCEGFGLPVLEALSCGAPTLTSTRVPLPGLAGVAALCEPRFPRSIAHQLEKLLSDSSQSPETAVSLRVCAARRAYASRFRWDETARRTLAVYQEFS